MNINEVVDPELSYLVAKADNRIDPEIENGECIITHGDEDGPRVRFDLQWFVLQIFSAEVLDGLVISDTQGGKHFQAAYMRDNKPCFEATGETAEIAAARAYLLKTGTVSTN